MLVPGFALRVIILKRCNCLCNHLRLGTGLVESLVQDEHKEDGGGAIDKAHIGLSDLTLAADGQRYNVAGS